MPVIFSPYLEKLRNRDEADSRTRRRRSDPDEDASGSDAGLPVSRRVALGLLVAGTVGAFALYVRRRSGKAEHPDIAPPGE